MRQGRKGEGGVDDDAEQRPAGEGQADAPPPAEPVEVGDRRRGRNGSTSRAPPAKRSSVMSQGRKPWEAPAAEAML